MTKGELQVSQHRLMREAVIKKYGGMCECCSETEYSFLVIDHRWEGGNAERRTLSSTQLITKLYKNPAVLPAYRVLCANCNMSLAINGICKHYTLDSKSDYGYEDEL